MAVVAALGVLVGLILALVAFNSYLGKRKGGEEKELPPMPWPCVPFLGHLATLNPKKPFVTMTEWGKRLGPVMRVKFASHQIIVLNSLEAMKEAFTRNGDTFHGRPNIWLLQEMCDGKGIILADGSRWREQRRFSLHRLRDLGFGKSMIEAKIQAEIDVMLAQLGDGGSSVDVVKELQYAIANIITSIVYGHSFQRGDPDFETFQVYMNESMRIIGLAGALMFFPWLRHVVPGGLGFWRLMEYKKLVHAYHLRKIREQAALMDEEDKEDTADSDNFVRAFMKEARSKEGQTALHYFDEEQLLITVADLFFAGQETTVTTLRWALLFLVGRPECQERMLEEMKEKVGRVPRLSDRNDLPYCQAAVFEAQRRGNIIPFGVWHSSIKDATLAGYHIPAGSTILPNIWAVMMDPLRFPEPQLFRPERWLEEDGSLQQKREGLIPFSIGSASASARVSPLPNFSCSSLPSSGTSNSTTTPPSPSPLSNPSSAPPALPTTSDSNSHLVSTKIVLLCAWTSVSE